MADIVLTTLNAKYIHAAFGLRYLLANLGPLRARACLVEFDINQRPLDIVESLLAHQPRIIGFGIYIWNVASSSEILCTLKRLRPELIIILGGPEVSYEPETHPLTRWADYVISGEADLKFAEVCGQLLAGQPPAGRIIAAKPPEFRQLAWPYELYDEHDLSHRVVYVEASRGCPFQCEFCLSSLDIPVRQAPLPALLDQLQRLLDRGLKQFKFVDRTFNLNLEASQTILEFLLTRYQPGHFFHFEMVPDRLPEGLRALLAQFPPGALQLEIGIQTFNPEVGDRIKRRQNYERLADNLAFLRHQTGAHLHADLIVGLPGESLASFAAGFDRLVQLGPQEIQVGILKRLRGTPIARHDTDWRMLYNPSPPYEILENRLLDFATMQTLRRFARYWDLLGNSGNFVESTPWIWRSHGPNVSTNAPSPFHSFLRWTEWLYQRVRRTDSIALVRLMELLYQFLTGERGLDRAEVAAVLWRDYQRGGRHDKPAFLKEFLLADPAQPTCGASAQTIPKRQARHLV